MRKNITKIGFYTSLITLILTVITFSTAVFTPPLSGPYCTQSCFNYPYTDILSRFPRDYLWMFPAIFLSLSFYVLMLVIHYYSSEEKKIFSHIGSSFALISTVILVADYFLQLSVIQPSLVKGETEGIALLTQFNAHGVFIALEELGFLMMSLSLFFMAPVFSGKSKIERTLRFLFIGAFVLTITALIFYSIMYGINREYRFEIVVISINWITLIISSSLLTIFFKRSS